MTPTDMPIICPTVTSLPEAVSCAAAVVREMIEKGELTMIRGVGEITDNTMYVGYKVWILACVHLDTPPVMMNVHVVDGMLCIMSYRQGAGYTFSFT